MAIQNRRGSYTNFDPQKLKPGEWAIVQSNDPAATDGKTIYIAFSAGDVKRIATFEDMQDEMYNVVDRVFTITDVNSDGNIVIQFGNGGS